MAVQAAHRAVRDAQSNLEAHDEGRPEAPDDGALRNLRAVETQAVAAVAAAREAVTSAERAAEQLADVRAEIAETVTHLDDWKHLQEALGRRGVQALEIDAASPEVSSITNELLHACYGSRFSVALETTKLKADGKGSKEIVDLRVLDTERGTDGSASLLSGGEKVLVGEALSLAIAIYNSRRSHVPLLDLFRDECAGALSSGNAQRYIEMLRRALDVGGFHRCYFVAHQPQLWDLADRIIEVSDGGCRVVDGADVTITVRAPAVEEAA
jgi:exonuclease SbcC